MSARAATAPRAATAWVPALAIAIASGALAVAASQDRADVSSPALAAAIALLALATLLRPIEPAPGEKLTLAGAIGFFAALVLPGLEAVAAIFVATLASRLVRRTSAISTVVNVAKATAAVSAAVLVDEPVRGAWAISPQMLWLLGAGVAYVIATLAPIALMIHWTRGPDAAGGFLAREAIPTVSLVAVGALAAVVWSAVPPAILLLVFPLASVELAARASARARAARDQLRRSLEAQTVFAADAAHELRNPLATISGNLAYVDRSRLASDEAGAVGDALSETRRLSGLVERLLLLSRADALANRGSRADLAEIVRRVAARTTPRPGVRLSVSVPSTLLVAGVEELIDTTVSDLLANAASYTERGEIAVSAGVRDGTAELVVRDTGIGIGAADLERIFDRFYRGTEARRLARGSGLGLAIARRVAEAHGGSLRLASASGNGTTATLLLPAVV